MNRFTWMFFGAWLWLAALPAFSADTAAPDDKARFTATGELLRPENYREWIQIGGGIGMVYGPVRDKLPAGSQAFTNVFVNPSSYRSFLVSGAWPDRTVLVLEIRSSRAVNKAPGGTNGLFQGEILGLEAEVKDESRFPGKWGFFGLSLSEPDGKQIPTAASCYSCHARNGAVENTFTQFYPVLRDVARRKGTLRQVAEVF